MEEVLTQGPVQKIQSIDHITGRFGFVEKGHHHSQADELEGLDKGTGGPVVIDRVHLQDMGKGMVFLVRQKVLVLAALEESPVLPFFVG